ncbi:MAG: hypothetical protein GDA46_00405 [Bdellovibrionales bacterium]|nr:hypothetical protein [Bdellovibrionales bacterium]
MSIVNVNAKELHLKISYFGAKGVGKKSSLKSILDFCIPQKITWMCLPFKEPIYGIIIHLGQILNLQTYFHIYHINNESKEDNKILIKGSDGYIFVASLDLKDKDKNHEAFLEMEQLLLEQGQNLLKTPLVLQYHKKDLKKKMSLNQMRMDFNKYNFKDFQTSHLKNSSVIKPLKCILKLTLSQITQKTHF